MAMQGNRHGFRIEAFHRGWLQSVKPDAENAVFIADQDMAVSRAPGCLGAVKGDGLAGEIFV